MTKSAFQTRIKKSYSISREVEGFVRRVRKLRALPSDSEALDQLLRESIEAHHKSRIDAEYKAYYDSASDADLAQEKSWAEFGEAEMAELVR
jgi:hypothetical protein